MIFYGNKIDENNNKPRQGSALHSSVIGVFALEPDVVVVFLIFSKLSAPTKAANPAYSLLNKGINT